MKTPEQRARDMLFGERFHEPVPEGLHLIHPETFEVTTLEELTALYAAEDAAQ
jgi:hypothetical protein